ncbi:hypothetical protein L9F63_019258, partial [Diploptera punctata]
ELRQSIEHAVAACCSCFRDNSLATLALRHFPSCRFGNTVSGRTCRNNNFCEYVDFFLHLKAFSRICLKECRFNCNVPSEIFFHCLDIRIYCKCTEQQRCLKWGSLKDTEKLLMA